MFTPNFAALSGAKGFTAVPAMSTGTVASAHLAAARNFKALAKADLGAPKTGLTGQNSFAAVLKQFSASTNAAVAPMQMNAGKAALLNVPKPTTSTSATLSSPKSNAMTSLVANFSKTITDTGNGYANAGRSLMSGLLSAANSMQGQSVAETGSSKDNMGVSKTAAEAAQRAFA